MVGRLADLEEAIDSLSTVDVDALTDGELHDAVVELQRQRARLGAFAATLIRRWDQRQVWAVDGSRSAAQRLARDTCTSSSTARLELRRARQLSAMPGTAEATLTGALSLDHVDLLGRASRAPRSALFARDEAILVAECRRLRFGAAVRAVTYWSHRADAALGHEDAPPSEAAALHASSTLDGSVVVNGVLDPIGGTVVVDELARLERELYLADQRDGIVRTTSQRNAAALVAMAERSAVAPADGKRPRPLFTVLLGDASFTHLCELANGTVVTPAQLAPWMTTADLETILFDGPSVVVSVSHKRTFAGALRRAIEVRDRRCQHRAGCDVPADRCDVDHIVPWNQRGPTSQFNGRLECPAHNRHQDKHDAGAQPRPARPITRLDEVRARLRWRYSRDDADPTRSADTMHGGP